MEFRNDLLYSSLKSHYLVKDINLRPLLLQICFLFSSWEQPVGETLVRERGVKGRENIDFQGG